MLSTTVIERPLSVLLIDAAGTLEGGEADVSGRLLTVLSKRGAPLGKQHAVTVTDARELDEHAGSLAAASCLVLLGNSKDRPGACLDVWHWLAAHVAGPKLAVACQWGDQDPALTDTVLRSSSDWAPIAVVQESPVAPREGSLFLLKFLTEMELHSDERMTGRMAWFAWKKAGELLKRRRMEAKFGLRS